MKELKIAVLGTGSAGTHHLKALRAAGAVPVAVPLRPSRRTQLEAQGFETAASLREAVEHGAKACVIATDTGRHAADASEGIAAGLDILIEKPLAARADEVQELLKNSEQHRRIVHVACVLRFSPSLNRFRERLPDAGKLHSVRVECRSYLPDWRPSRPYQESYSARARDGGVLRDLIHEIDYSGWLFGWPQAVSARLANLGRLGIESEERAELGWELRDGGPSVSVSLDYLTRNTRRGILACGDQGEIAWDAVAQTVTWTQAGQPPQVENFIGARADLYEEQARAFLSALSGGNDQRLASLSDGFRALAICDAARASSKSGRLEKVLQP